MKISAPSGDLLLKLALGAIVLGTVAYVLKKASTAAADAASSAAAAVSNVANAVSPWNNENVIYQTANAPVRAITGDKNATLGTWIYDIFHSDQYDPTQPVDTTLGHSAYWKS